MVDNGLALLSKRPMTPVGELPVTGAQHAPAAQHATGQQLAPWGSCFVFDVLLGMAQKRF